MKQLIYLEFLLEYILCLNYNLKKIYLRDGF